MKQFFFQPTTNALQLLQSQLPIQVRPVSFLYFFQTLFYPTQSSVLERVFPKFRDVKTFEFLLR